MNFPIENAEELKKAFGLDDLRIYEEFNAFKDDKPGFSIKRPYPKNIPYVASVTKTGKPNTVAMIRVLYNPNDLPTGDLDQEKVPIWIDIGLHDKYRYLRFGYNFEDEDCPTADSIERSQSSPQPIALDFFNEYFYSHQHNTFVMQDGTRMTGAEVLEAVFIAHCETTHETRRKRWKMIAKIGILADRFISFFAFLLRVLFRKKFDESRSPLQPYRKQDVVLLKASDFRLGFCSTFFAL
jgi:hypothetical protein